MREQGAHVGQRRGVAAAALQLLHRRGGDVQEAQTPQAELRTRNHQVDR